VIVVFFKWPTSRQNFTSKWVLHVAQRNAPGKLNSFCTGLLKMSNYFALILLAVLFDWAVFWTLLDFTKKRELVGTLKVYFWKEFTKRVFLDNNRGDNFPTCRGVLYIWKQWLSNVVAMIETYLEAVALNSPLSCIDCTVNQNVMQLLNAKFSLLTFTCM